MATAEQPEASELFVTAFFDGDDLLGSEQERLCRLHKGVGVELERLGATEPPFTTYHRWPIEDGTAQVLIRPFKHDPLMPHVTVNIEHYLLRGNTKIDCLIGEDFVTDSVNLATSYVRTVRERKFLDTYSLGGPEDGFMIWLTEDSGVEPRLHYNYGDGFTMPLPSVDHILSPNRKLPEKLLDRLLGRRPTTHDTPVLRLMDETEKVNRLLGVLQDLNEGTHTPIASIFE